MEEVDFGSKIISIDSRYRIATVPAEKVYIAILSVVRPRLNCFPL